jgi:hypothetical protein
MRMLKVEGWKRTELEFSSPNSLGRVGHEVFGEIALYAADHVVMCGFATLAYDTEGVVLHY